MELRQYLGVARRWWWLAVLATLAASAAAYFLSDSRSREYEAQATLLVNQRQNPTAPTYNDILSSQQLVKTYADVIESRPVLERALDGLPEGVRLSDLESGLEGEAVEDTQLLRVRYRDSDPERAATVVNRVADEFVDFIEVAQVGETGDPLGQGVPVNTVFITEPAVADADPVSPQPLRDAIIAGIVGLMLAVGIALLFEYLDDTIKKAEDLEPLGIAPLGSVRRVTGRGRKTQWAANLLDEDEDARIRPAAEDFWVARANLEFALSPSGARLVEVVSAEPGAGKTTVTGDLAVALAESGWKVLVVDCDLRKPSIHQFFGLPNSVGLSTLFLRAGVGGHSIVRQTRLDGLSVITSGPLPPNPTELLSSDKMKSVLRELAGSFDLVLLDTPPARHMADASLLATVCDAFVLVIHAGKDRPGTIREVVEQLGRTGRPILGAVLNQQRRGRRLRGYDAYYGYGYGREHGKSREAPATEPPSAPPA